MTKTLNIALVLAVGLLMLLAVITYTSNSPTAQGSVPTGGEYQGTTTSTGRFAAEQRLVTGSGALGSVVITGAAAGVMNFYDATTSDITLRTGNTPTSTILVATFPTSAAANTYTFDRVFFNGLYVSITGVMPTTTITFR